jgi:hypothetical protein
MMAPADGSQRESNPWVDCSLLVMVLLCSGVWGSISWHRSTAAGLPFFYQNYFEPAVMIACRKGFVVAQPQIPAMTAFLAQQVDRFSCDAIPSGAILGAPGWSQEAWRYLMFMVGWAWRVLGVSWSGLGPLFALLFAVTIGALYAVFRLGMSPWLAALCALGLSVSRLNLEYLPILRDYAKAPFTLILVLLLGLLVKLRPTYRTALLLAAAYGVVLGVAYGFRADFLVDIPPFFLVLTCFLKGGPFRNLRVKAAAGVLCLALLVATAWPIILAARELGGCQWHTALLGFPTGFSRPLGLMEPPYKLLRVYSDDFVFATTTSYAARLNPATGSIGYCKPEYDAATGRYLWDLARHFPGDMIVRAYGSVLRIVELPFSWNRAVEANFEGQRPGPAGLHGFGLAVVLAAIVLATVVSTRNGLFMIFFILYFGGYPAVQFQSRHYFHLEFVAWWAAGFVLQSAIHGIRSPMCARWWRPNLRARLGRSMTVLAGALTALALVLWSARAYQQTSARTLFESYLASAKEEIPLSAAILGTAPEISRTSGRGGPERADFLEVDVNGWRCESDTAVTFRYDRASRGTFSRRFIVQRNERVREPTHIFTPVYNGFQSLEFSNVAPGCVAAAYRVRDPGELRLMLEVVLTPGWRRMPLYQQFGEVGPPEQDAVP